MPFNRFYYPFDLKKNQKIVFKDEEFNHLKVMRLKENDQCDIVNGNNLLAKAVIYEIQTKQAILYVKSIEKKTLPLTNVLCTALLKPKKLELILEKGIELAITKFCFFTAERSTIKEFKKNQIQRLEKILIAAIKQCGRFDIPKIEFFNSLSKTLSFNGVKYFGDTSETALPFNYFLPNNKPKMIVIGPEKGFTNDEIKLLENNNVKGIKLAQFILKAETAAISAASLMAQASLEISLR
jgi:16S rRNA (uracil1498-N3)-methyltransferase